MILNFYEKLYFCYSLLIRPYGGLDVFIFVIFMLLFMLNEYK